LAKRTKRKPKAAPADTPKTPVIVEARDPRRVKRKQALATCIVDHSQPDLSEDEHHQRDDAADRLWQEIERRVAAGSGGLPSGLL
jgi:hypothetical protein